MSDENQPLACVPSALTPDQQEYWVKEIVPKLYREVQEIQELPNGWVWRLPSTPQVLMLVAEDLNMERLCCPFVNYTLEIEPNHGPFWLRMTGGEGVKEFELKFIRPSRGHGAMDEIRGDSRKLIVFDDEFPQVSRGRLSTSECP